MRTFAQAVHYMPEGQHSRYLYYDSCANRFQKALKEKGIDTMLEDARNDMKDTDAETLRQRCKSTFLQRICLLGLFASSNSTQKIKLGSVQ